MVGVKVSTTINIDPRLSDKLFRMDSLWVTIRPHMNDSIERVFKTKGAITNTWWKPNTKKWKRRKKNREVMIWTGTLRDIVQSRNMNYKQFKKSMIVNVPSRYRRYYPAISGVRKGANKFDARPLFAWAPQEKREAVETASEFFKTMAERLSDD